MVGNQLLSFNRRCGSQRKPCLKLVIQVEHGKVWLPKGMKLSNHPKVKISQPLNSLPAHLRSVLLKKSSNAVQTRTSSDSLGASDPQQNEEESLFQIAEDSSVRHYNTEKGYKSEASFVHLAQNSATQILQPAAQDEPQYLVTEEKDSETSTLLL